MIEIIVIFVCIFVVLFYIYYYYQRKKEIVEYFPKFFQEIHNNTSSGMSLVEAARKSKNSYYGRLTPLIRNMCYQIEWGVPFPKALRNFSKKLNNLFVNRIIALTEKASEFSPDIGKSIEEINNYILLTRNLKKERSAELFPQLISVYFIFFVFLFIIFILFNLFIPSLGKIDVQFYKDIFIHLIFIEAIITSFVLGKISENSYLAGMKHLIILLSASFAFLFVI